MDITSAYLLCLFSYQKQLILQATIENAIKRSKNTEANAEFVFEIRGPGNTFIIVEAFAKHKKVVQTELNVSKLITPKLQSYIQ